MKKKIIIILVAIIMIFASCSAKNEEYRPSEYTDCSRVVIIGNNIVFYTYSDYVEENAFAEVKRSYCKVLKARYDKDGNVYIYLIDWLDNEQRFMCQYNYWCVIIDWRWYGKTTKGI